MANSSSRLYYKHNRIKQLRAFCFVAQSGTISKAAERMFLSQPSVSLQIQALERELDITLFERRGPKIRLTPDGETLYELALPLVEGIDSLSDQFHARRNNVIHGRLDIAAGESTTLYLLPELLRNFKTLYPGVTVKLHNIVGKEVISALRADEVDFAIGSVLDAPDDILYKATVSYGMSLICPPNHPLAKKENPTLADIAKYDLILPSRHLGTWRIVNMVFQQHSITYNVALEIASWEIIKKYVEMNFGVAIISDICLTEDDKFVAKPLSDYFPKRTYGVVLRRGKFLSPHAKRFIELLEPSLLETDDTGVESISSTSAKSSSIFVTEKADAADRSIED